MDVSAWTKFLFGPPHKRSNDNQQWDRADQGITPLLNRLSPGIRIALQYAGQQPVLCTFQGMDNGIALFTNFTGFSGLVRIAPHSINAISIYSPSENKVEKKPVSKSGKSIPKLYIQ